MSNPATLSRKRWTPEEARHWAAVGNARKRALADERARTLKAVSLLRSDSSAPSPARLDELISRCISVLSKHLGQPKGERIARMLAQLTAARRNLHGIDCEKQPSLTTPDAPTSAR